MKFIGDVIITDPCYIIKKQKDRPSMEDYSILKGKSCKKFKNYTEEEKKAYKLLQKDEEIWEKENPDDWDLCEYGNNMEVLGIKNYITKQTIFGDWSCTTFNANTKELIGKFCADAGLVSVFLLDEVLAYNPEFDYHINNPWTTTLIKDFDGNIEIRYNSKINEMEVIGKGNINFYTTPTI